MNRISTVSCIIEGSPPLTVSDILDSDSPYDIEDVESVEIDIRCPYCDDPTILTYTPPLLNNTAHRCESCSSNIEITGQTEDLYEIYQIEDELKKIDVRRKIRQLGEHRPTALTTYLRLVSRPAENTLGLFLLVVTPIGLLAPEYLAYTIPLLFIPYLLTLVSNRFSTQIVSTLLSKLNTDDDKQLDELHADVDVTPQSIVNNKELYLYGARRL